MLSNIQNTDDFDLSFKVYNELMAKRVSEILLISSPYDAFIMEEDGRLAERIIHEYRGLNLSRPPRLTWVSTAREAFEILSQRKFDLVITMPRIDDMDSYCFARRIKEKFHNIPVFLLTHSTAGILVNERYSDCAIDRIFVWYGNTDLLLAMLKSVEDCMNVNNDTIIARVRVIIMTEDSPWYYSSILPILYKEIVIQTNAVMEESVNEEHRILRMRARPKILLAENFEDAENLYRRFKPYVLSVLSDVRFPREGQTDAHAGFSLLSVIKRESPDIPMLIFSSEEKNREAASKIPAVFLNKNSPTLHIDIRSFFVKYLGFGDFVFRLPDGSEVARASNIRAMEKILPSVPDDSVYYHALRNDFSSWLMARSEVRLASKLRPVKASDFSSIGEIKEFLINCLRERRKGRQKGVVTDFSADAFDPDSDFVKIGMGSMGGKARGLAFMQTLLEQKSAEFQEKFPDINISVPKSLVITTEGFDAMVNENRLKEMITCECSDSQITELSLESKFPQWLQHDLEHYLSHVRYPLAVRSSSLLEDAMYQSRAGIYKTYMIPNNHPDLSVRLSQLINAVRLVYASTFWETSRTYSKSTLQRTEEEKMAVIIQQLTGTQYGDYFYPAIAGVAQSYNFYPVSYMKPDEGIIHLALGLGKIVVEGGTALRFSPAYPQFLPQFSKTDDILKNSQRSFYALNMKEFPADFGYADNGTGIKLDVDDLHNDFPIKFLSGTYLPEEHKIRDSFTGQGHPVLTFANILKYKIFPLAEIISGLLEIGRKGMGCPVEIEFAVNIPENYQRNHNHHDYQRSEFALLQIRPMAVMYNSGDIEISDEDIRQSICFSDSAMGNGRMEDIKDIVYVEPDTFDSSRTIEMAGEIRKLNKILSQEGHKYLLVGPGRWGSADRWLGIPVTWNDISGVGAIIETYLEQLQADPSQGSHFFNNITSLGISYITVKSQEPEVRGQESRTPFIAWDWLKSLPVKTQTTYLKHLRLEKPLTIKIDGKRSCAVILP